MTQQTVRGKCLNCSDHEPRQKETHFCKLAGTECSNVQSCIRPEKVVILKEPRG